MYQGTYHIANQQETRTKWRKIDHWYVEKNNLIEEKLSLAEVEWTSFLEEHTFLIACAEHLKKSIWEDYQKSQENMAKAACDFRKAIKGATKFNQNLFLYPPQK